MQDQYSPGQKMRIGFENVTKAPTRAMIKLAKGKLLGTPDIAWAVVKKLLPPDADIQGMNLDQAMDWAMDYNPSGFSQMASEFAEFGGSIGTAGKILPGTSPHAGTIEKGINRGAKWAAGKAGREISKGVAEKIDNPDLSIGERHKLSNDWLNDQLKRLGYPENPVSQEQFKRANEANSIYPRVKKAIRRIYRLWL